MGPSEHQALLRAVSDSLRTFLASGRRLPPPKGVPAGLDRVASLFVTLWRGEQLRGCIGSIEPRNTILPEAMELVIVAGTEDPRFPPLQLADLAELTIDVSILSPFERAVSLETIIPGRHGVLVQKGGKRGLFLPQVWSESGWSKEEFLKALCEMKAGIRTERLDDPTLEWYVFETETVGGKAVTA